MMDELPILLYTTPEGAVKVKAVLKDETMWLTQASGVAWCGAGGEEEGGESRWRWRWCGRDGEVGGLNGRTTDRV